MTRGPDSSVVVRPRDARHGPVTLRIDDGAVELSTLTGGVRVRTGRGFARLRLPFRLPDQVAAAAIGQPAGVLVGHPWFAGSRWPIRAVVDRGSTHELVVATGRVRLEKPWRAMLWADAPRTQRAANRS